MDPYMLLFSRSSPPYVIPISVPIPYKARQSVPLKLTTHEHGRRQVNTAIATHCIYLSALR